MTFAVGSGSQYILVIPDARVVVVSTGGNDHNGNAPRILSLAGRLLAPGVRKGP